MKPRLSAILCKSCPALGWKVNPNKTCLENLTNLLEGVNTSMAILRKRNNPAAAHLLERNKLKKAFEETGLGTASAALYLKLSKQPGMKKTAATLAKKSEVDLLRELLALIANEPKIRAKSHTYDEAWSEIEGNYFVKMSLYRVELTRREA